MLLALLAPRAILAVRTTQTTPVPVRERSADVGGITTPTSDAEVQNLVKRAFDFSAAGDMENAHAIFERVLRMQPNNANALVQLGMRDMTSLAPPVQETAFRRLERSFDADVVPMPVPVDSFQGYTLAMLVGRRKFEVKQFASAVDFFAKAMNSVNSQGDCAKLQYATSLVTPYPADAEARSRAVAEYHRIMDAMLEKRHIETPVPDQARTHCSYPPPPCRRRATHRSDGRRRALPQDPHNFCMLPVFYHAFHFTGDGRSAVGKYFKVAAKAWPDLLHVEPKLLPDSKPQYAAPQPTAALRRRV